MASEPDKVAKANHLCVLVHGLWGNPSHLDYVSASLRERYKEDRLFILAAQQNSGTWTYDGIEVGGERVAREVEETLEKLDAEGYKIQRFSVVGYSLGGLVSRYALGLLDAKGWLDTLEPVNFTTFASPHVGTRSPLKGVYTKVWNHLGARTVSLSGQQLFMVDDFRNTGKPLLSILADPDSIFIRALSKFKNRTIYANILNDRSVIFYTSAISKVNPFEDPENINFNYVKGYEPIIIDPDIHVLPTGEEAPSALKALGKRVWSHTTKLPYLVLFACVVPVGTTLFLLNAVVQNFLSEKRIRLHKEGKTGEIFGTYKVPFIVQEVRGALESAFENVNASQKADHLSTSDEFVSINRPSIELARHEDEESEREPNHEADDTEPLLQHEDGSNIERTVSNVEITGMGKFPTLALTPEQFKIIDSLNAVGFRKYPVYIHKVMHTHAAMIVRIPRKRFDEGKVVIKHWLDNEFEI